MGLQVTIKSAREGYCSACNVSTGEIAHVNAASWITRFCPSCARELRKKLKEFARGTH